MTDSGIGKGSFMNGAYVVGIAGASAGGKTTVAAAIRDNLQDHRVKIIHMDDYYKAEEQRPKIKGLIDGYEYIDDNHPMALDMEKCLEDIRKSICDNWDIVIVEGIFALWDERISALLNLKIYVDCDPDERMARRIKRHLSYGQSMEEITERYVQAVQPRQREYVEASKWKADILLNGFSMSRLGVDMVVMWLKEKVCFDIQGDRIV